MPSSNRQLAGSRRAFLRGGYLTRSGRARLAAEQEKQGAAPVGAVQLDPARCLAWQRMACRGCVDSCGDAAIRTSAGLEPVIDPARCSGCASCVAVCPVDAIHVPLLGDTCV